MNDSEKLFKQILEELKQELEDNSRNEASECSSLAIKEKIANYKRNLDLLDDCIFVDVLDELANYHIDMKQFDELLNKEELTESEETYVSYLIDFTSSLICQHIVDKIQELEELLDEF